MPSITVHLVLDNHRGENEAYEFQTTLPPSLQPTRLNAESFARSMHNFNTAYDWSASLAKNLPRFIAAFLFVLIGALVSVFQRNDLMFFVALACIAIGVTTFAVAIGWHYLRMEEQLKRAIEKENEYYRIEECSRQESASSTASIVWSLSSHLVQRQDGYEEEPIIVCTVTDWSGATQTAAGAVIDQVHQIPTSTTAATSIKLTDFTASIGAGADFTIDVQQLREPLIYPRVS